MSESKGTHTVMPKKLAQALMEAGMQHFDVGGTAADVNNPSAWNPYTYQGGIGDSATQSQGQDVEGGSKSPLGGTLGPLFGMNTYSATGPTRISQNDLGAQGTAQFNQQQDVYGQQQSLANQLLQQTQGSGPGAQLLAAQSGQLGGQQAAMMASQRGASANPALVARQAALAGAQGQQQLLNAQSGLQLQSQGALAQQQSQMANQAIQGRSVSQGAIAAQNAANLQAQAINAGISAQNASTMGGLMGGLMNGSAASGMMSMFSKGGEVKKMADGGPVDTVSPTMQPQPMVQSPTQSFMGTNYMAPPAAPVQGLPNYGSPVQPAMPNYTPATNPYAASSGGKDGGGGGSPLALLALLNKGGPVANQMLQGGNVKGKASVRGDSEKNDTVPTLLSPGEIVIPRSIAQAPDAAKKAAEFIAHLKKRKPSYDGIVAARKGK